MTGSPVLRWIGSLLAGTLAGYLSWLVLGFTAHFTVGDFSATADSSVGRVLREAIPHAASGAAFVYVTTRLAPPGARTPFLALLGLIVLLLLLVLLRVLAIPAGWQLVGLAGVVLGGGLTTWLLSRHASPSA